MSDKLEPAESLGSLLRAVDFDPTKRFLFVDDLNDLFCDLDALSLGDVLCPLVRYENPLQLRDTLEDIKDHPPQSIPLAIVLLPGPEIDLAPVADLLHRAQRITVTPRDVLEHLGPHRWPPEINLLRGTDFWRLADGLLEARPRWEDTLTASNLPILIAETFLGRSLRGKLSGDEATALWEHVETDELTRAFLERYPRVSEAVQRVIQRATPIDVKLDRDPDFAVFLWTVYFLHQYAPNAELLLPQFFDERTWEKYAVHDSHALITMCDELIERDPLAVVSQVRMAERALTEDPHRERLFLSLLGLEGDRRVETAFRIASTETVSGYLTEQALRVLIPEIATRPTRISRTRMERLNRTLERRHLGTRYPVYFPHLADTIGLFKSLLQLSTHIETFHARGLDRNLALQPIEVWMEDLYPDLFVPMSLLWENLMQRRELMGSLLGDAPAELVAECQRVLVRAEREFARLVSEEYVRWIVRQEPPPRLTVDFLDTVFLPRWRALKEESRYPLVVVCLIHGLRWDEWEIIRPVFDAQLTRHRHEETMPLLTLLPTTRVYNTAALILGRFPSLADSGTVGALFSERLAAEGIPYIGTVSTPNLSMPDEKTGVLLANIGLPEIGGNKTRRTGEAKEEIQQYAMQVLGDFLSEIPPKATVFVLSNGGTTAVTSPPTRIRKGPAEIQRRWIGFDGFGEPEEMPSDVALFNANTIHLPNPQISRCAFAFPNVWFATEERDPLLRFLCGGISLTEMIIPASIYAPRRRRRRTEATKPHTDGE